MHNMYLLILLSLIVGAAINCQGSRVKRETTPRATAIKCGDFFPNQCQKSKYRTYDGSCNNELYPTWGMAFTRYVRLLPAKYADGIHSPRVAKSGKPLPLPRTLTTVLNPDVRVLDKKFTLLTMQYGQIIAHDMLLSDPRTGTPEDQCCSPDGKLDKDYLKKPLCYPLIIPENDPDYKNSGIQCLSKFLRFNTDLDRGCSTRNGAADQLTIVSQALDLSPVYGSSDEDAASLRKKKGGRLMADKRNNRDWPPTDKTQAVPCNGTVNTCYKAGDIRINQNPELVVLQIHLLREHNRAARILSKLNPHWTDEQTFQETRKYLIALHQSISYNEWLPLILGLERCADYKLIYKSQNYVNDYNVSVDLSISNEFAASAFRSLHTLIDGNLQLVKEDRKPASSSLRLNDHFFNPTVVEQGQNYDDLSRGVCTQPEEASDKYHSKEITVFLGAPKGKFGSDLRSFDIQRGRDGGLNTYNEYRYYCGLPRAINWSDLLDSISPEDVKKLSVLYECPDDVDLAVGAMLETNVPGALVGRTFHCILTHQFLNTRQGDRFWFENENNGAGFTPRQLNEIRKASISRLMCDNGDDIKSMQLRGFEQISKENPLVNCKQIPSIDLSLWKENAPAAPQEDNGIKLTSETHFTDGGKISASGGVHVMSS